MNQLHRAGLAIAGVVTTLMVAGAFVVQGYVGAQAAAATPAALPTDMSPPSPTATPSLEPETIYINPVPTPAIVKVVKPAPQPVRVVTPPTPAATPPVIHIVVPAPTGGDDGGGDD